MNERSVSYFVFLSRPMMILNEEKSNSADRRGEPEKGTYRLIPPP